MSIIKNSLYSLLALVCISCSQTKATIEHPVFSSDSAYSYIAEQMSFGPRVPNGKGHTDCAAYLVQQLQHFGGKVELQKGFLPDYSGRPQQIINIIGHFRTDAPGKTVLLCAHYDTRPWCDEEEEYDNRYLNVPGANDGASGVGVLLEVARQLSLADSATAKHPIDIIFFDCEDMGTPSFYTGPQQENTWCLGSQLWSAATAEKGNKAYQYGILLDMVGAPDALFMREAYSTYYADNYVEKVWRCAETLGYGRYFSRQQGYPIVDDHYYVNTIANIPCVNIVHHNSLTGSGFPAWWHTRNDDMTNISRETLQAVGEVILKAMD